MTSFSTKLDEVLSNLTFQAVNLNNEDTSEDIESEAKEQIIKLVRQERADAIKSYKSILAEEKRLRAERRKKIKGE